MSRNPKILMLAAIAALTAAGVSACGQTTTVEPAPAETNYAPDPMPPAPMTTTLTETDARTRIEGAGYTNVTALTQAADGAWTATATQNGANVNVVIDSTGAVTVATAPTTP